MADRVVIRCTRWEGTGKCAAGVDVEALRDDDQRLPCIAVRGMHGVVECDERVPPAPEHAELGPLSELLARAVAGCCPECGEPVASTITSGGFDYAVPCQHRLGRSRAA